MTVLMAIYATLAIALSISLIIFARRYKNSDKNAGKDIAYGGLALIMLIWFFAIKV